MKELVVKLCSIIFTVMSASVSYSISEPLTRGIFICDLHISHCTQATSASSIILNEEVVKSAHGNASILAHKMATGSNRFESRDGLYLGYRLQEVNSNGYKSRVFSNKLSNRETAFLVRNNEERHFVDVQVWEQDDIAKSPTFVGAAHLAPNTVVDFELRGRAKNLVYLLVKNIGEVDLNPRIDFMFK